MGLARFLKGLPAVALLGLALLGLSACNDAEPNSPAAAPPPTEVSVLTLKAQPVSIVSELPGRVVAYHSAEVRPQVNGILQSRLFEEGSEVKAGQQLYQIDPAPYEAALASAKASLARAQASVTSTRSTAERYRKLLQTHVVSQQNYEDATARLGQDEADVAAAQAAIRTAEIDLAYTKVYAPIDGITSRSTETEGALVTASQAEPLVSITQLDPIYVDMTQPSNVLLRLKREYASGRLKSVGDNQAEVTLVLDDGTAYGPTGRLQFSEVTVDRSTGSVILRAIFPNPDRLLMPGLFVRARLEEGVSQEAILVPQRSITRNERGEGVALVVGADGKVEQRVVQTDRTVGDAWIVADGLAAGDRVIVEGLQKVRPGAAVKTVEASAEFAGRAAGTRTQQAQAALD